MEPSAASNELDLVFALDCTGSMGSYIESAKKNIEKIIETIQASEKRDVQFAVIGYRDHPPQDSSFITQVFPFTKSVTKAKSNISGLTASGGGDTPEAVTTAIHDGLNLDGYRKSSTKVFVIVADAPPHGLGYSGDGFPEGEPNGHDPMVDVTKMAENSIIIYSVGTGSIGGYGFTREWFQAISMITGGRYISLDNAQILPQIIVGGAEEEMELEKLMGQISEETKVVEKEWTEKGKTVNEKEVSEEVSERLKSKGVNVKTLQVDKLSEDDKDANGLENPIVNKIAECKTMAEVRKVLKDQSPVRDHRNTTTAVRPARGGGGGAFLSSRSSSTSDSSGAPRPAQSATQAVSAVSSDQVWRCMNKMKSRK